MPRIAKSEAVVPKQMSDAERSALIDALFPVHSAIFEGVDRARTASTVVSPPSDLTTILLHKDDQGAIVGFFAIHFYDRELGGKRVTIGRSIVGTLREYRGQNVNIGWGMKVLGRRLAEHPGRPFYGFGLMAHPSSYSQISRYVNVFWPKPNEPVPPDILAFMLDLADEFGLKRIDPRRPLVRGGAVPTHESEAERAYWRTCDKPAARYYVDLNPEYNTGTGVVTLFPVTIGMLAGIAARMAREKAERAWEGALAVAQRTPLGEVLLRPAEVRRRLMAAPLFTSLDEASVRAIAARAEVVSLPGAHRLFRAGDRGDELYLVARGVVRVSMQNTLGDDDILDQLGPGAMFGEIAVLTGGTRSATVTTAIPTVLVTIPGDALRSLMRESARVRDAIWGDLAARVIDDHLRAERRFPDLDRTARFAWLRRSRHEEAPPGALIRTEGDALLALLHGKVALGEGASRVEREAPFVMEPAPDMAMTAVTGARVAHVPPMS